MRGFISAIELFPNLIAFCNNIKSEYFNINSVSIAHDFENISVHSEGSFWDISDSIETLPPISNDSFTLSHF